MIPPRENSTPTEQAEKLPLLVMDIAQHPVDPNLLFLAYEGLLLHSFIKLCLILIRYPDALGYCE